jgi:transcriptional regulator with GAF, ATPase, and Fis domain
VVPSEVECVVGRIATLDDNEREHIRRALAVTGGKIHGPRGAANILAIKPSTLRSRMEKLGIGKVSLGAA